MKSLVIHHDDCLRHDPGPRHPERADRVVAVMNAIADVPGAEFLPAPLATRPQLERAHEAAYLQHVEDAEPEETDADGDTPRVAVDPDTLLSAGSIRAALRGSGAACFAVDQVFAGRARNAFCVTRPPGHHAEPAAAMGFCLFNHAAVAARHALAEHGARRVAILDFDVHHGNGTQAIFERSPEVLFVSSHQYPLYPGTGQAHETGCGNVLNLPLPPGAGSDAFRGAWEAHGLPRIEAFRPDLIVVSAGFDGHWRDPLAQLELDDPDFGWITTAIRDAADRLCSGRLVSVLEGGYDLEALGSASRRHLEALAG